MLVPLAASLVSSFVLWCLLWVATLMADGKRAPFWKNYRAFLGLFWLTAPLAWLYAIPVERFLDPVAAVKANYALLGIVAAWRVLLMIRVAQVFTGRNVVASSLLVLCFGHVALMLALRLSPWPVIEIMSGARHNEIHRAHVSIVQGTFCIGILAAPALLVAALFYLPFGITARRRKPRAKVFPALRRTADTPAKTSLWVLAGISILAWLPLLPFTQPPLIGKKTEWDLARDDRLEQRDWWEQATTTGEVLHEGQSIRVFTEELSLLISAESKLERRYQWGEQSIYVRLKQSPDIHGNRTLIFEGADPAPGVAGALILEGSLYFKTEAEALDWLKSREIKLRWTNNGYAAAWEFKDGRLVVELWQVHINYTEPESLPEASDGWFKISR